MLHLTTNSLKTKTNFVIAVTLAVTLSACAAKQIQVETSEAAQNQYLEPIYDNTDTTATERFVEDDASKSVVAPARVAKSAKAKVKKRVAKNWRKNGKSRGLKKQMAKEIAKSGSVTSEKKEELNAAAATVGLDDLGPSQGLGVEKDVEFAMSEKETQFHVYALVFLFTAGVLVLAVRSYRRKNSRRLVYNA